MNVLSHKQISKKGGLSTLSSHGREHFSALGKKGAQTKLKNYGREYFVRLSKLGVASRKAKAERQAMINELSNRHIS